MLAIFAIGSALTYYLGRMTGNQLVLPVAGDLAVENLVRPHVGGVIEGSAGNRARQFLRPPIDMHSDLVGSRTGCLIFKVHGLSFLV